MDWGTIIIGIISLFTGGAGGIGFWAYLNSRKKVKSENIKIEADADKTEADAELIRNKSWSELLGQMGKELDRKNVELSNATKELIGLRKELLTVQADFKDMLDMAIKEEKQECDQKINQLKREYEHREEVIQEVFTGHLERLKEEMKNLSSKNNQI